MPSSLDQLIKTFSLEKISDNEFSGEVLLRSYFRIFGGEVLAQCQVAAVNTVDSVFVLHSMHGYFLRAGDPHQAIRYLVEDLRQGKNFSTRRVAAFQGETQIFVGAFSFQRPEPGLEYQKGMPNVAGPEGLESQAEFFAKNPEKMGNAASWPIETRDVIPFDFFNPVANKPYNSVWIKAQQTLPDDLALHQQLLAYISDDSILMPSMRVHGVSPFSEEMQTASLDHAMWFHRPFRIDDWLLYSQETEVTFGSRALISGSVYNQQGELVASVRQEGLIRQRDSSNQG